MLFSGGKVQSMPAQALAKTRINLTYFWRHGRLPNLENPQTFTELVQDRKLHDHDPRMPPLADKVAVKSHVAQTLGPEWVIPTLWHGDVLPVHAPWPRPFMVKSRHGSSQCIVVREANSDWVEIQRKAQRWMQSPYGAILDEWVYRDIERGLLVETYIGTGDVLPIDYKVYVFGGVATYVQVHLDRASNHRWMLFDPDWRRVSSVTNDPDPQRPESLGAMIDAAELLGRNFDFVRVDLYERDGRPLFGEMTFYPGSGLDPFDPVELDGVIGAHWLKAREKMRAAQRPVVSPELPVLAAQNAVSL